MIRHEARERYTALRDVIARRAKGLFSGSGQKATNEEFHALRDVSFTVNAGDRVGIIGRNGAGKSTLLKILSRITEPSAGRVVLDGRVASLLEVGTGFHPELTGRENIFLNGAILGMSRAEINRKFDEIVAFSEVERFLDTPVKRYSSGMYVRLAFAVAAHLEPEILVVDEVLAVGDSAFQKKCMGKMEDVSAQGRTVLFVSHQMDAVQRLCEKGLLLDGGRVVATGRMKDVVERYLDLSVAHNAETRYPSPSGELPAAHIELLRIETAEGALLREIAIGQQWQARVVFHVHRPMTGLVVGLGITSMLDLPIRTTWSDRQDLKPGRYEAVFQNDGIHLADGVFKLVLGLSDHGRSVQYLANAATLTISEVSMLVDDHRIVNTKSGLLLNQMPVSVTRKD